MFDKFKDMYQLKKQADALKRQLAGITVKVKSPDGGIEIEMNGEQKVNAVVIGENYLSPEKKQNLELQLKNAFNNAVGQTQQQAANKMKDSGGLSGLLGGM